MIQPVLARYNNSGVGIELSSQELGYLTITLVDSDVPNTNPVQIFFIPDGKLSINLIMEFKRLNRDMRLVLGSSGSCRLKIVYETEGERMGFILEDEASTMSMKVGTLNVSGIVQFLDEMAIVVATNTFYHMDLSEVGQQAVKSGRSIRHTVTNTVANWLLASNRSKPSN